MSSGDWVVGDADGVTVVPEAALTTVIEAGRARARKEEGMFEALRSGSTTMELLGLDPGPVEVADCRSLVALTQVLRLAAGQHLADAFACETSHTGPRGAAWHFRYGAGAQHAARLRSAG